MPSSCSSALGLSLLLCACGGASIQAPERGATAHAVATETPPATELATAPAPVRPELGPAPVRPELAPAPVPPELAPAPLAALTAAEAPTAACVPGAQSLCTPRGERPRIVLDESLTPTEAGLPALSADGTELALAVTDPERAISSLLIRFVRAQDGVALREHLIVSVEEALALEDIDVPDPALRARIEARVAAFDAAMTRGAFAPVASRPAEQAPRLAP